MPGAARAMAAALAVAATLGVAACGSSKPSYCSDVSSLQQSVKDLGSVDLSSGGVSALESQLKKVEADAKSVVSSAKDDFPNETSALQSSVDALSAAVKQTGQSPSAEQAATLAKDVKNVSTATQSFTSATDSKCS